MKGKPWSLDDEKKLKEWVTSGVSIEAIVLSFENRFTKEAVLKKANRLGLEVVGVEKKIAKTTTSKLELPEELPSVEETLKTLAGALKGLQTPGLDKCEVLRLRGIISGAKVYQERVAEYVHYREIETELLELRQKYAELLKKSQDNAPK